MGDVCGRFLMEVSDSELQEMIRAIEKKLRGQAGQITFDLETETQEKAKTKTNAKVEANAKAEAKAKAMEQAMMMTKMKMIPMKMTIS